MKKMSMSTLALVFGLAVMPLGVQAATEGAAKSTTASSVGKSAGKEKSADKKAVKEAAASQAEEEKVSMNKASAAEFSKALNGVGLKKGQTIVEYREEMGPFTQIEQLQEVPGIGPALFQRNQSRLKL